MLKFTSVVGYASCGPTYIESFLTIFGQCINVLNYNSFYRARSIQPKFPGHGSKISWGRMEYNGDRSCSSPLSKFLKMVLAGMVALLETRIQTSTLFLYVLFFANATNKFTKNFPAKNPKI